MAIAESQHASNSSVASITSHDDDYMVVLYYKYVCLGKTMDQVHQVVDEHRVLCEQLDLNGRVRIAKEGINGTLGGRKENVEKYIETMKQNPFFQGIDWKTSTASVEPFPELQVRLVTEIVSMEIPDEKCQLSNGGQHLTPEQFHLEQQNSQPDQYALIDVRNHYEYNVGHFEGALNPKTRRFGQFPEWVDENLTQLKQKDKILMYCTGGIRCEKASAYLKHLGLEKVYQLEGGIHRYLEQFPDGGLFKGKNFVFDQRVMMASQAETIAGKCEKCQSPHDIISGTRCAYCRMHILLCDTCLEATGSKEGTPVYCEEHVHLVEGGVETLEQKAQDLRETIAKEAGRNKKGKRRSLRKQLDTVEQRLEALHLV